MIKQELYYGLMEKNAKIFSLRMIQRLGLETYPNNKLLCVSDELENGVLAYFSYDGIKYVAFENAEFYPDNQEIKVFDPYNNIRLCINCVLWYMQNVGHYDTTTVDLLAVTNQKMNDSGMGRLQFTDATNNGIYKLETNHFYNRDCLKYLDLIYAMDEAIPPEYDELASLDMVGYDEFNPKNIVKSKG
jgi:hypothetical protein